jgi:hypothetical protein
LAKLYERLKDYTNWAFGITVTVAFSLLIKDKIIDIFNEDSLLGVLCSLLMITTVIRYFVYLNSGRKELDMIDAVFDYNKIENPVGPVFPLIIFISVCFGALIAFSIDALVYSIIFCLFALADIYGQGVIINNVVRSILESFIKKGDDISDKLNAHIYFYIEKPLLLHASFFLVFGCVSIVLSIIFHYTNNKLLLYFSYIILIMINNVGEYIILRWRIQRDKIYYKRND